MGQRKVALRQADVDEARVKLDAAQAVLDAWVAEHGVEHERLKAVYAASVAKTKALQAKYDAQWAAFRQEKNFTDEGLQELLGTRAGISPQALRGVTATGTSRYNSGTLLTQTANAVEHALRQLWEERNAGLVAALKAADAQLSTDGTALYRFATPYRRVEADRNVALSRLQDAEAALKAARTEAEVEARVKEEPVEVAQEESQEDVRRRVRKFFRTQVNATALAREVDAGVLVKVKGEG